MKPFDIPDLHFLRAARGWIELGNHLEANEELENISPELRTHPRVLELRWEIYAKESKWDACKEIAQALIEIEPNLPSAWSHLAYATRRATGGGVDAARDVLAKVVDKFPNVWEIPFNLACYCSVLREFDGAQSWLKKAMAIDEKTVQPLAIQDADLQPLWDSMSGTIWIKNE